MEFQVLMEWMVNLDHKGHQESKDLLAILGRLGKLA